LSNPTFVLVHGAWHTGASWHALAERLRSAGATVHTPSLLSHGDDGTSYTEVTSMEQYARPALDAIEASSEQVVLVGHSLGGSTLNYLAEVATDRIARLAYVTAALLPNGKAATDVLFDPSYTGHPDAQSLFGVIAPTEDGMGIAMDLDGKEGIIEAFYADCSPEVTAQALSQLVRVTPMTAFASVSEITPEKFGSLPRLYVEAASDHAIPLSIQRWLQEMVPGSERHSLDTSHSPFLSQPDALADILLAWARPAA